MQSKKFFPFKKCRITKTPLLAAAILLAVFILGCNKTDSAAGAFFPDIPAISLYDIPGITPEEIAAIEALRRENRVFVYGMPLSEEMFIDSGGNTGGFAARFCLWLTNLFGIQFVPEPHELQDIIDGLENGAVDFTGELRITEERRKIYTMTDPIAERRLKIFRLAGSPSPEQISETRKPRYGFIRGAATLESIAFRLEADSFDTVIIDGMDQVRGMLQSGEIDAFFYSNTADSRFTEYPEIESHDFYPLVFSPVSLAAQNPKLAPVITVVQKILQNGGRNFILRMYSQGYQDYRKNILFSRLTKEEREYIGNGRVVPYAAEYYNYPISFYNAYEKKWRGIFFDVLNDIETLTGLSFRLVNDEKMEWSDLLRLLEDGKAHMISELLPTAERNGFFLWPGTSLISDYYMLVSKLATPNITINEVAGARIALISDTAYAEMFRSWFPGHEKTTEFESYEKAFSAMERGEIDMVMTSQRRLIALTNYHEYSGFKANLIFHYLSESFIGVNINEPVLCSIIDKALTLINIESYSDHWMNQTYDYQGLLARRQRPWLIGITVLLFLFLALVVLMLQKKRHEGSRLEKLVKRRTEAIARRLELNNLINDIAVILLESNAENYMDPLNKSMEMICVNVNADRIYLWQNIRNDDGKLSFKQVCKWTMNKVLISDNLIEFTYDETLPEWKEKLSEGQILNGPIDELLKGDNSFFKNNGIQSILAIPLFFNNNFWGFVSIDDCNSQRYYAEAEVDTLHSWSFLAMGLIQRGEIAKDMRRALTKSIELQKELETAVEAAKAANSSKSAFLANMSHEIRTPLNAIIGFSELELGTNISGESAENIERIYDSGMVLLGIINDLLDISKVESGKLELVQSEYHIPSLINDTVNLNIVRIGSKPIEFKLHPDENLPAKLYGDELRVKQIFNNLLSNAFKYTRSGTVDWYLSSLREGETVWLVSAIKDTGIGIKKEDIPVLFNEYAKVDKETNKVIEGTGLGLPISLRMAHLMDGDITVTSDYGKGSTFKVKLRQKFAGSETIGRETANNLSAFKYSSNKRRMNRELVRVKIPDASVLVVDDMPANLAVARGILKPYEITVDCAASGPEAIEKLRAGNKKYDAVFMDHMMPEMNGMEAVKIIRHDLGRESSYARDIPIIALTANAIIGNEDMFLQNGFQAFLTKPINILEMDAVINRWIRDKKPESQSAESPRNEEKREVSRAIDEDPSDPKNSPEIAELIAEAESIAGIDIRNSLARIYWDRETWIEVIRSFIDSTPALLDTLRKFETDDIQKYTVAVHGIKSVCYGFGATEAGDRAKELEEKSRAKDMAFIGEKNADFISRIEKLIVDLGVLLIKVSKEESKQLKDKPDPQILEQILEAALRYDIREMENKIDVLEKYNYSSESDLVPWLRRQCNSSDFAAIQERLAK